MRTTVRVAKGSTEPCKQKQIVRTGSFVHGTSVGAHTNTAENNYGKISFYALVAHAQDTSAEIYA